MKFYNFLICISFVASKSGGGGGGSSGSAFGGKGFLAGKAADGPSQPLPSWIKWFGLAFGIMVLLGCIAFAFLDKLLILFRTKKDLKQYLGAALARIVNIDVSEANPDKVEMGIGQNPDVINDWVEEIWDIFDVDGSGDLDLDELNFFVGEVFRTSGIKVYYNKLDLNDLFSYQDKDNDGTISK